MLVAGAVTGVSSCKKFLETLPDNRTVVTTPEQVARGAYLALAGNCATCHTARGGAPYACGRGIEKPFGVVYSGKNTPDDTTGL